MPELDRLTECNDFPELEFVEREVTPKPAMKLGIQLHLAGLSLADTVSVLAGLGVELSRIFVHNWIQKADLQLSEGHSPNQVAVDETVIQANDQRYWLYAAVAPATTRMLHIRLFPTKTTALTEMFLTELHEKHLVDDTLFLVDGAPWLQAACHHQNLRSTMTPTRIGIAPNGCSRS